MSSKGNKVYLRRRGIRCTIPIKEDQAANRRKRAARGGFRSDPSDDLKP